LPHRALDGCAAHRKRGTISSSAKIDALHRVLLVAAAFGIYALFARRECQGDGSVYHYCYAIGFRESAVHFLSFPILQVADFVARITGMSELRAATLLCGLGTAVGLGFVHAAVRRLGAGRRDAALLALVVGSCPAVILYATVYELHGVFFAFVGLAYWAMAAYVARPRAASAILVGCCCGAGYLAHATGAVLVGAVMAFGVGLVATARGGTWRAVRAELPRAAIAVAASIATILVALVILQAFGSPASLGAVARRAAEWLGGGPTENHRPPGSITGTLWYEWLVPFFPVSVLWVTALRVRELRWVVITVALATLGYVAIAFGIAGGIVEFGSYVLPMAVPAAWLALRGVRGPVAAVAMALAGWVALQLAHPEQRAEANLRMGAEIRAHAERNAVFLIAWWSDLEPFLVAAPDAEWYPVHPLAAATPEVARALSDGFVTQLRARSDEGDPVLMTDEALALLSGQVFADQCPSAAIVKEQIEKSFRIEPFARDTGFPCHRLVPL
jgi:hypothetical protein